MPAPKINAARAAVHTLAVMLLLGLRFTLRSSESLDHLSPSHRHAATCDAEPRGRKSSRLIVSQSDHAAVEVGSGVATSTFWSLANGAMEDFKGPYEEFRAAAQTAA